MGMSASLLGRALDMTGREMNVKLREHGYLEGGPGDYSLTDKGRRFGTEKEHHRGNGGYDHYNRVWETRTWDESIVDALAADMARETAGEAGGKPVNEAEQRSRGAVNEAEQRNCGGTAGQVEPKDDGERPAWVAAAAIGTATAAVLGGAVIARSPRVHRWVARNVTPRTQRAWNTLTGRESVEADADHAVDAVPGSDGASQDETKA